MTSDSSALRGNEVLLTGELNINRVGEIKEALLRAIESHSLAQVRIVDAVDIDTAFLQLLCSAHRSAVQAGRDLRLQIESSPLFHRQLRDCGFLRHTGCRLDCNDSCIWVAAGDFSGASPRSI